MIILLLSKRIKARTDKKVLEKSILFKLFDFFVTCLPFISIIIGANIAWRIKHADDYNAIYLPGTVPTKLPTAAPWSSPSAAPTLDAHKVHTGVKVVHDFYSKKLDIVGEVASGLDILRTPKMRHPFGPFFADVIPLTLIAFMESYSVARRLAVLRNELHILNASQEMIANGMANLLGCVSSAYPVSGSFSRSSLNHASGARSPLSKVTTLLVVITALMTLAETFQYIPKAVLAAVIFVALYNLVVVSEFWEAWRRNKKDFFIMVSTAVIVFVFDTSIGLAVGLGLSFGIYLIEVFVSPHNAPQLTYSAESNDGFAVVKVESDLGFIHASTIKDFVTKLYRQEEQPPSDNSDPSIALRYKISSSFDYYLISKSKLSHVDVLPKAIIIDLDMVKIIDLTGTQTLCEIVNEAKAKKVSIVFININRADVKEALIKSNVRNYDNKTGGVTLSEYLQRSPLSTISENVPKAESEKYPDTRKAAEIGVEMVDVKPNSEYFIPYNNI